MLILVPRQITRGVPFNSNFGSSITFLFTYKGQVVYAMPQNLVLMPCFGDSGDILIECRAETTIRRNEDGVFWFGVFVYPGSIKFFGFDEEAFLNSPFSVMSYINASVVSKDPLLARKVNFMFLAVYKILRGLAL